MYKTNKIFNEILKLSKFSINGAIAVLVDIIVYSIIVTFPVKSVIAQPISVAVGLTVSYFLNKKITFKSDKKIFSNEIVKYIISSIFIIFISPFFIVFYSKFIKNEYYVKLPVTITTGVINYIISRVWVYRSTREDFKKIVNKIKSR